MRALGSVRLGTKLGLDVPIFSGFGQFGLYILSLGKQA